MMCFIDLLGKLWHWYPPIGVYIGILGLIGVLVPLLRERTGKREKAIWTAIMFLLLLLEVKSIYQEKYAFEMERAKTQRGELAEFNRIAYGIDTTIDLSKKQFDATMKGLSSAALNTHPRAYIIYQDTVPQVLPPALKIAPGQSVRLYLDWTNTGNEEARDVYMGMGTFVDSIALDDKEQKRYAKEFENYWKTGKKKVINVQPFAPVRTEFASQEFEDYQVNALYQGSRMLHVIVRWEYSDSLGRWRDDTCIAFKDFPTSIAETIPCEFNNNQHYAIK